MFYRYEGTNGSMGLFTGNRYQVHIEEEAGKIYANVFLTNNSVKVGRQEYAGQAPDIPFMPYVWIPYDNSEKFLENWTPLNECRCTHPGEDDGSNTCWEHHDCTRGDCTHGE